MSSVTKTKVRLNPIATNADSVKNVVQFISNGADGAVAANNDLFVDRAAIATLASSEAAKTIEEVNNLFVAAKANMQQAREALYDYLQHIYQTQVARSDSREFLKSLVETRNAIERKIGRDEWTEKKLKRNVDGKILAEEEQLMVTEHLLFVSTNGMQAYGSLRSKYKKLIRMALEQSVRPELFVRWIKAKGGVVKALAGAVERDPKNDKTEIDVNNVLRELTRRATRQPTVDIPWDADTYQQFTVVVVYHDPQSKRVHQVGLLKQEVEVKSVIRMLGNTVKREQLVASKNGSTKEAA
jgi:hypothetical protein